MPKAILSVHDKTNLIPFARGLRELGWTLIASGGTARALRENQIPVTEVAEYTQSPEILGGRVKTLHPAIHGGLLARSNDNDLKELQQLNWDYIDLVAVNLYPFEKTIAQENVTLDDAIENIDIGGVTLIRAAAKNFQRVTLVCDPNDYENVLNELREGGVKDATRKNLAVKGFSLTAHYDTTIHSYLANLQSPISNPQSPISNLQSPLRLTAFPVQQLRYGENPHQRATLYSFEPNGGALGGRVLQGKELSYNNLLDLDAAWRGVVSFSDARDDTSVVIVKHLSPCGIASAKSLRAAFEQARASDPISAFGGVIAANRAFDAETANALGELFVECIAAPAFTDDAREILAKRKNLRLVEMPDLDIEPRYELRTITRGILKQDVDFGDPENTEWKIISKRAPSEDELRALKFAWKVCQHVKSNAIVFARNFENGIATVGIGGGQPNRVDCVKIAAERAGEQARGAVMASDAFFPFPDSVEVAARAGITAIIHPGGSVRDADSLAVADANNIAMVVTGARHFRH
ncbi:MAG: bifunctional phosphoribosylaminoimidazolecarboxamide formyltransferase/IMP cyclohydrolase [Chloroflexi bacterium UTCFX4]|jgi:phosphoribosylaminoimidazolecarboxamide formyltransferase/IMP cyclohydrolase|nr:MAG: bifunctional phosphoribosylaminoimidazolecarboxamide formyltransferase/IMP cyclohydrolase [Chloroflexi bacterium UTCFX4]